MRLRDHSQPCATCGWYSPLIEDGVMKSGIIVCTECKGSGGRDIIIEHMVERMAESRYNARFGGFAWTDPNHVTDGYTRDAFTASARRDLIAAIGDVAAGHPC